MMPLDVPIAILLIGAMGGYLGGIVGAGIGAIVVPGLVLIGIDPKVAIGSSLLLHVFIGPLGGISHYRLGHVRWRIFSSLALAGMMGAFLGAAVSTHLPGEELTMIVGISTAVAGLSILANSTRHSNTPRVLTYLNGKLQKVRLSPIALIGFTAGISHGALGTGWGPIGVPLLILAGVVPHVAVGSSLLARTLVALVGGSTYYAFYTIQSNVVLPLLAGGSIAILLGALTAKKLSPKLLKLIVGIVAIVLGSLVIIKWVL